MGFWRITLFLSQWGISAETLLDAQYISAGLLLGIWVIFTYYFIIRFCWDPCLFPYEKIKNWFWKSHLWLLFFFFILIVVVTILMEMVTFSFLLPIFYTVVFLHFECTIATLTTYFRIRIKEQNRYEKWITDVKNFNTSKLIYKVATKIFIIAFSIAYVLLTLFFNIQKIPTVLKLFNERTPPAFGGEASINISVVMNPDKIYKDFISADFGSSRFEAKLRYQNKEKIVLEVQDRVWVLPSDLILGYQVIKDP
jgi:hypothetical protein